MVVEVPSLLSERPRTSENQFKMYSARVLSILSIYTGPTTHQTSNKIHTCAWRSKTLYSSSDLSFQFHMNKKGRVICEFETMKFKESFVCWRSNLTNDNISSAYARSETCMDFRDPGLKTGVENNNYLVLNRVRIWRNWATHRPRIPRTHIPPAILCPPKKTTTTTSTTAATYEADLLAEPNTPYLIQNLVTWRERERESV